MSNKIRVGILGCAQIAKLSLAPAFLAHPAFELVSIASRSADKAKVFIASFDPSNAYIQPLTYDELLHSTDINLIYCPLPTGIHHEWVLKALNAGKHVLCEKSLGCNFAEVSEMVETARANKCFLMESFQFRFHAQNLYVKELLAGNAIGELRQLLVRFGIPPFPEGERNIRYHRELGGGALLDNGAYTIKCATYLLGTDIKVLAAQSGGNTPALGNVDLSGSIMMAAHLQPPTSNFHPQSVCVQTAYGFDHFYQNGYELWGTKGKITTTRAFTAREDFAAPVIVETNSGREVKSFHDDHFARLMDYLANTIPSGDYETEYQECLIQSQILGAVAKMGGLL